MLVVLKLILHCSLDLHHDYCSSYKVYIMCSEYSTCFSASGCCCMYYLNVYRFLCYEAPDRMHYYSWRFITSSQIFLDRFIYVHGIIFIFVKVKTGNKAGHFWIIIRFAISNLKYQTKFLIEYYTIYGGCVMLSSITSRGYEKSLTFTSRVSLTSS